MRALRPVLAPLAACAAAIALLLAPAGAVAKGIESALACGASGCRDITAR